MFRFARIFAFMSVLLGSIAAQPFGIDSRAENSTLLIDALPASPSTMQLVRVFPQLAFSRPVLLVEIPDGSGRLCMVERTGRLRVFPNLADPAPGSVFTLLDTTTQTLFTSEQGLLGVAFDPDYALNGELYVYYSYNNGGDPGATRVSRFVNPDPAGSGEISLGAEQVVFEIQQPFQNHNGGMIAFGPDGHLYIALGDGGSGNDPLNAGQDTTTALGSILRLDVRTPPTPPATYVIPADNPFANDPPNAPEIYAWGLRNPWRFSFDMQNGLLYCGDVGQSGTTQREEVNVIRLGGNYGWKIMEGFECRGGGFNCDTAGLLLPIHAYPRSVGNSITGGFVYYGAAVPELYGHYIFGDFGSRLIGGLEYDGVSVIDGPNTLVADAGFGIAGFGQDSSGEVYVLQWSGSGGVYVLRPASPPPGGAFPTRLSEIPALLAAGAGQDQTPAGILPYEPSAKLWSDGALKERFLALPGLTQATFRLAGGWDFPAESVIIKNFLLPLDESGATTTAARRIETRLLVRLNGLWNGFSYEWNDAQTDALLVPATGKIKQFSLLDEQGFPLNLQWQYPSRAQCSQCHTDAANGVLGLATPQMNFDLQYPASGVTDNQLRTLDHIAFFDAPLPDTPDNLPRMPDPADTSAPLQDRARAYLAANCSMCHQPGGPTPTDLDLRWETGNGNMQAIDVAPGNGDIGIPNGLLIAPGEPARSILLQRMDRRGVTEQMPPLASERVDEEAVALIREWILSLAPGPANGTDAGRLLR